MAPPHGPQFVPRTLPTKNSGVVFMDTIQEAKDYVQKLVSGIDTQKYLPLAAFAGTLGLGAAALYLSQQSKGEDLDIDDPANMRPTTPSSKSKPKPLKRRNKRSTRVAFQNPLESEGVTTSSEVFDAGDHVSSSADSAGSSNEKKGEGKKTEGQTEPNKTKTSVDENNNIVTTEVPPPIIQNSEDVLILKQCPRGRKTPCIAPFPLKLETFLRVHKLKYEVDFNGHEPRHYGSPWIRFNTEDIVDSQLVMRFLIDKYHIKVEKDLTAEQRSMATAYRHLLENHLYWGIALWRWVYDGARSLKDIQLLPKQTQELIPDVCKTVEQAAWFHGIGKMSPEEVKRAVLQDLRSLSEFLGTKNYFLSTSVPTELDCTAFGMLSQFLWNIHGPFHDAIVCEYQNLKDFCWRIRLNYWPDWEECLNNTQFYTDEPYPIADTVEYPY